MFEQPVVNEERARGFYDLDQLLREINREYFPDHPPLPIRWGQRITRKKRFSIRLGSYNHQTREIRIHPLLDSPVVPRFFIESIIHHEYLHHVLGPNHNRRFHAHEKRFRFHRESQGWLKRNLHVLLGRQKRRQRSSRAAASPRPAQLALF